MNTYKHMNMNAMKQVIKALSCLPSDYAILNEAVIETGYLCDELIWIKFPAMEMKKVSIPSLEISGWMLSGSDTVHICK